MQTHDLRVLVVWGVYLYRFAATTAPQVAQKMCGEIGNDFTAADQFFIELILSSSSARWCSTTTTSTSAEYPTRRPSWIVPVSCRRSTLSAASSPSPSTATTRTSSKSLSTEQVSYATNENRNRFHLAPSWLDPSPSIKISRINLAQLS